MAEKNSHLLFLAIIGVALYSTQLIADESVTENSLPSADDLSKAETKLEYKTNTVYESSWLPGVRLCEDDEVDYHGGLRKVNCQDDRLIDAVSTRKPDLYGTKPNIIVDDRVQPNGNILRINFRKKVHTHVTTSDN